jgi:Protein of unknown function (DUF429)
MRCVGFDPGGRGRFGWCIVQFDCDPPSFTGGVCDHAEVAVRSAQQALGEPPEAIGVDAPLFWVSGEDRVSDREVRRMVRAAGGHNGTVLHVNSLQGACLVQGILVAWMAARSWPGVPITEAHPKALLRVSEAARAFSAHAPPSRGDHVRDAALAAFAARASAMNADGWRDLAALEKTPFFPAVSPVRYWFPIR